MPRFPEPSTETSALVTASALWSMCRLLAAAARLAALPDYAGAGEVFGEGLDSSPLFDRGVEGGHFLLHQPRAHLAEVGAEAVPERLALGLAVVREHHDVVAPGSVPREPLERSEDPIQAVEGCQGLGAEHAGMVGDLVVIDVVDVDALGALAHLLRDDRGVEVALQLGLADGGGHRRDRRVIVTEQAVARAGHHRQGTEASVQPDHTPHPDRQFGVGRRQIGCVLQDHLVGLGLDPLPATTHKRAADEEEQDQPEHRREGD